MVTGMKEQTDLTLATELDAIVDDRGLLTGPRPNVDRAKLQLHLREALRLLHVDLDDENLADTPRRWAESLVTMTSGYDFTDVKKLTKINTWFAGELRYLVEKLSTTPEPGSTGSLLDNTLIIWTNELGKGNSHTLDNIPFLLIGGGFGFKMGRSLNFNKTPHNRLHLALAHGVGHRIETFGKKSLCEGGALSLS